MKWILALGALLASLAAALGGRIRWKGRAEDASQEAQEASLDAVGLSALLEKERALAKLEKTRALSDDERLALALARARIRRANPSGGG